jgi:hypothetical protein
MKDACSFTHPSGFPYFSVGHISQTFFCLPDCFSFILEILSEVFHCKASRKVAEEALP